MLIALAVTCVITIGGADFASAFAEVDDARNVQIIGPDDFAIIVDGKLTMPYTFKVTGDCGGLTIKLQHASPNKGP